MIVEIRTSPELEVDPIATPAMRRVLRRLIARVRDRSPVALCGGKPQIDVTLVDEDEVRRLNAKYRQEDRATDVHAFPLLEELDDASGPFDTVLLGDVVIAVPVAAESAEERSISLLHELAFLACHGALHLLGWDHPDERSLQDMHSMSHDAMDSVFLTEYADDWDREGEGD